MTALVLQPPELSARGKGILDEAAVRRTGPELASVSELQRHLDDWEPDESDGSDSESEELTLDTSSADYAFRTRFRVLSRDDLCLLPPLEPLIADTLDRRTLALLAGPSGVGKSFIAADWAACVATGRPWRARATSTGACGGRVLYVVAEGAYGFDARLSAWERCWTARVPATFEMVPEAVNLMATGDIGLVAGYVAEHQVDLVVIDTLSRCMPGADENTAHDMSIAIRNLDAIREAGSGTCVLVVHHTGKDRHTVRGSSALEAACDTVYVVDGESSGFELRRTKRKDGPLEDTHRLAVSPVAGTESAVVLSAGKTTTNNAEGRLLSAFVSTFGETGATKADLRAAAEMPPASFHRGVNALLSKGMLINHGTDKRPFYRHATE